MEEKDRGYTGRINGKEVGYSWVRRIRETREDEVKTMDTEVLMEKFG